MGNWLRFEHPESFWAGNPLGWEFTIKVCGDEFQAAHGGCDAGRSVPSPSDVLRWRGADYVNMFDAQLERAVNSTVVNSLLAGGAQPAAPDSYASLKGQAADWGYHAGIVVQPNEKNAIGITYHSKVNLRVNGNVTLTGMSAQMAGLFGGCQASDDVVGLH